MVTVQHIGQRKNIGGMNFEIIGGWGKIIGGYMPPSPLFRHPWIHHTCSYLGEIKKSEMTSFL